MDVLAARIRCIFFVFMLKHPIQVLSETELLGRKATAYQKAVIGILLKERSMFHRIKRRRGLVPFCAVLTLYLFHLFIYPFVKFAR